MTILVLRKAAELVLAGEFEPVRHMLMRQGEVVLQTVDVRWEPPFSIVPVVPGVELVCGADNCQFVTAAGDVIFADSWDTGIGAPVPFVEVNVLALGTAASPPEE
jgi:hypothetical protein